MDDFEPLLLVEGNKTDGNLSIISRSLSTLLAAVENVPLAVVSVAGPPNTGKSLIFGYLIRYLLASEKDDLDWNYRDNPEKELTELIWRHDKSPKHPGIWSFPRPFLVKNIAIILLYCQTSDKTVWDGDTTESCSLLGLVSSLSSLTFFNLCKNMNEECLNAIAASVKLAAFCEASSVKGKNKITGRFQEACFLIRDWRFPSKFQYGLEGGNKFLRTEKLVEKASHSKQHRENRCVINGLFAKISACLFPFPGINFVSLTEHGYSVNEMGQPFSEKLSELLSASINIDDITLKKDLMGSTVTGKDFKENLQRFLDAASDVDVNAINTKKLLRRFRINIQTTVSEQKASVKPAMRAYVDVWKKYEKKGKTWDEKSMKEVQKKAKKKALATLEAEITGKKTSNDLTSDSDVSDDENIVDERVKKQLLERVAKRFQEIKLEKARQQADEIEKHNKEILEQYIESLESFFPSGSKPPPNTRFTRKSKTLIETLVRDFEDKLEKSSISKQKKDVDNLIQRLKHEEQNFLSKFQDQKEDESTENDDTSSNWSEDSYGLRRPQNNLANGSSNFLQQSRRTVDRRNEVTFGEQERELTRGSSFMQRSDREIREKQRKEEERLKTETKQIINRCTQSYQTEMQRLISDPLVDLTIEHQTLLNAKLEQFEDDVPYSKDRNEYNLYKDILKSEIDGIFLSAKSKKQQISRKKEADDGSLVKRALEMYEDRLKDLFTENENITLSNLESQNQVIEREEIANLSKSVNNEALVDSAKRKMEERFETFKLKVKKEPGNEIEDTLRQTKDAYAKKMRDALAKSRNESELLQKHETLVKELTSTLAKKAASAYQAPPNPNILKQMSNSLYSIFSDMKEKFHMKQQHATGSAKLATQEARNFYCQEMKKHLSTHQFFSQSELVRLHKKYSQEAKQKYPSVNSSELDTALEMAFKRFEDDNAMNKNDQEPAIGIDLGTTYSCVSVYQKGKVIILPNKVGKQITPSYVQFQDKGNELIGEPAKSRAYKNPEGTIFDAKRILGRKFNDPVLQDDMKLWPFTVVDGGHGVPMIEVGNKRYYPEMISAKVLAQLKKDAEAFLNQKVTKAVITVPAYFTDGQKQATIDAGRMADLEVLSILTEPVAAAMAYKLQYSAEETGMKDRYVLVFDLGGGTFDVAVVKASQGKLDVLTVDGDTHLGGEDFDKNLMNYCAAEFRKKHGIDLFDGKDSASKKTRDDVRRRLKRIQAVCEMQKIALTTARSVEVTVDNICNNKDLEVTITKATFEKINERLFAKTVQVVENALKTAKLNKSQIDDIVLVGGSTRIPKVQQLLRDFFKGKELDKKINPDEAVAHGAGLMAAIKQGSVGRDSTVFTKIQEVTPMSIGVEVYGGGFSVIIPRNTKTPVMLQERYKTTHNNQTSVQITIYEGENKVAVQNKHLGDFYLNGIPPNAAGVENINVEMVINDQGILHVTAKCSSTGKTNAVTVTENKQRMGKAAINRYLAEGRS